MSSKRVPRSLFLLVITISNVAGTKPSATTLGRGGMYSSLLLTYKPPHRPSNGTLELLPLVFHHDPVDDAVLVVDCADIKCLSHETRNLSRGGRALSAGVVGGKPWVGFCSDGTPVVIACRDTRCLQPPERVFPQFGTKAVSALPPCALYVSLASWPDGLVQSVGPGAIFAWHTPGNGTWAAAIPAASGTTQVVVDRLLPGDARYAALAFVGKLGAEVLGVAFYYPAFPAAGKEAVGKPGYAACEGWAVGSSNGATSHYFRCVMKSLDAAANASSDAGRYPTLVAAARDGSPLLTFIDEQRGELVGVSCFDAKCAEYAAVGVLARVGASAYGEFPHAISTSGPPPPGHASWSGPPLITAFFVQHSSTVGVLRVAACAAPRRRSSLCLVTRSRRPYAAHVHPWRAPRGRQRFRAACSGAPC